MMSEKIRILLIKRGKKNNEFCDRLGWKPSNFSNKLKRDNFSVNELLTIAEAAGARLDIRFELYKLDAEGNSTGELTGEFV